MAELNPQESASSSDNRQVSGYAAAGHPSVDELMADQGTGPVTDVAVLRGDFWPEEESIEDFLEALHRWRGHKETHPAA